MQASILNSSDLHVPRSEQTAAKLKVIYLFSFGTLSLTTPVAVANFYSGSYVPALLASIYVFLTVQYLVFHYLEKKSYANYYVAIALLVLLLLSSIVVTGPRAIFWLYPLIVGVALSASLKVGVSINLVVTALTIVLVSPSPTMNMIALVDFSWSALLILMLSHGMVHILLQQQYDLLQESITDPLTGLYNRRYLKEVLPKYLSSSARYDFKYAALMIDIDHFKSVNDHYGHDFGDRVLAQLAGVLVAHTREEDEVFRMGGEEFLVLARVDSLQKMQQLAELIRHNIESARLLGDGDKGITVSIGGCILLKGISGSQWISQSDKSLYQAKQLGRNRSIISGLDDAYEELAVPGA